MDLAALPDDVLFEIAVRLLPSRRSVDAMRGVCRDWRRALPPTRGPWLLLSPRNAGDTIKLLGVSDGALVPVFPLSPPPRGAICWGCSLGIIALRYPPGNVTTVYCVVCGREERIGDLPDGPSPSALSLLPTYTCAISAAPDFNLTWNQHFQNPSFWTVMPHVAEHPARSIVEVDGVVYIAAAPDRLFIDRDLGNHINPIGAEPGQHDPLLDELIEQALLLGVQFPLQPPPLIEIDIPVELAVGMTPWSEHGHHVFSIGGQVFLCVLLQAESDAAIVEARLFSIVRQDEDTFHLFPSRSIGDGFSLFLGANQAFAAMSTGLRPNTAYIVDDDGDTPRPRVLLIHFATQEVEVLPYPLGLGERQIWATGAWLAPLPEEAALQRHCI